MVAFGPFASTEYLDFRQLGTAPLFLINGPTGSGKTTVLDAICYALYGTTTGDERDPRDMRSQQAQPDLLTEVTFEFSLAEHSYQIARSPDQQRPKQRGDGFTDHKTKATLYRLGSDGTADSGELLEERRTKVVTEKVRALTGMDAAQFRQVMVLPQGQFRKLLMSDSKEREGIFEVLFQTTVYKRIEERLHEQSLDVRTRREQGDRAKAEILNVAGVHDEPELDAQTLQAQAAKDACEREHQSAQFAWRQAESALEVARKLADDFRRLGVARQALVAEQSRFAQVTVLRERVASAVGAAPLMTLLKARAEQRLRRDKAVADLAIAGDEFTAAHQQREHAAGALQAQQVRLPERQVAVRLLLELESYIGRDQALAMARGENVTAASALVEVQARLERTRGGLETRRAERRRIAADADSVEQALASAQGIEADVQRLGRLCADRRVLDELLATAVRAAAHAQAMVRVVSKAEDSLATAKTAHKRLQQRWHLDQAAALASQLDAGLPCPVCGSESHPSPAVAGDENVTQQALDQARAEEERVNAKLLEASTTSSAAANALDALKARIGESRKALGAAADEALKALEQEHKSASARAQQVLHERADLKAKRAALQDIDAAVTKLEVQIEGVQQDVLVASARAERADADYEAAMSQLPQAYREPGRLEDAVLEARTASETLERLLAHASARHQTAENRCAAARSAVSYSQQQARAAGSELQTIEDEWLAALHASQFFDEGAVADAALDQPERDVLTKQVRAHDDRLTEQQTVVRTLAEQLEGRTPQDTAEFEQQVRGATQGLSAATAARDVAQQRVATLTQARVRLDDKKTTLAALDAEYAVVGTLAEVACGSTRTNYVSFHRYVLGVLLDDVLVHASGRLVKMSAGRYQLLRKQQGNKGRQAAGLDLMVHDDHSGQSRPVSTLSGGESFMAALALALGLSDVVQAHTGGVRLETLFVDEGFGSLDAEALELAVATLMDLQRTGRTVGVISHVQELKEQLDLRVDILPNKVGSSLRVIAPAAAT